MFDNMPDEISFNILLKLPVKTLIKCTTLSKYFLSLITSRDFIYTHIEKNKNSHFLLRHYTKKKEERYHFECDDETFSGFQSEGLLNPFYNQTGNWFIVAGCVNGVLCLVNDYQCEGTLIILWNPSIRKYVHVPRPIYVFESNGGYESACGFGFDSISNDYKVVRVVDIGPEFQDTEVEVYSLRSGCWRTIGVGPCYRIRRRYEYIPCFLNGSIHWVGSHHMDSGKYENAVIKFDVSLESFEIVEVPAIEKECKSNYTHIIDYYLQDFKGMLTLIRRNYDGPHDGLKSCSIWAMKEYGVVSSWMKIYDFTNISLHPCQMPRTVWFRNNGEVIMVKGIYYEFENVIASIDPSTRGETILGEISGNRCSFYMSYYVESMVLFKEGKGIEHHTKNQLNLHHTRNQLKLLPVHNEEEMEE